MTLPALYQLAAQYKADAETLADLDLPAEVVADTLEGMRGDLETKATNVAMVVRNMEALAVQIADAEKQMAARRKAVEARAKHVREYLLTNMIDCGITEIDSPWFKLAVRDNPEAVEIVGEVPDEYMRHKPPPEPEPDKHRIKEALKSGAELAFARLNRSKRLEIK